MQSTQRSGASTTESGVPQIARSNVRPSRIGGRQILTKNESATGSTARLIQKRPRLPIVHGTRRTTIGFATFNEGNDTALNLINSPQWSVRSLASALSVATEAS